MSEDRQLRVSRTLAAPPERIFGLLADPGRHTELDGAGMLRGLENGPRPISAAGQAFVMNMNQGRLGDYRMRNTVVEFEANRRIVWAPSIYPPGSLAPFIGDADPSGHIYRWELVPTSEGGTVVTHVYDWSDVKDTTRSSSIPGYRSNNSKAPWTGSTPPPVNAASAGGRTAEASRPVPGPSDSLAVTRVSALHPGGEAIVLGELGEMDRRGNHADHAR